MIADCDTPGTASTSYGHLIFGWKSRPSLETLNRALNLLGVLVYEDPGMQDTDQHSYIFSKEPLTPSQLQAIAEELWSE